VNLEQELKLFSDFAGQETECLKISSPGSSILHLQTKSFYKSDETLGFLALVHGNEYLGLPILNSLINSLLLGELELNCDVYIALGNIPAALANQRFIEEDLNRCFGKHESQTQESKRARELESLMLRHCDRLIDIHQTISSAENPFFIFQYSSERCLSEIQKLNPGIPVILQEEQIGENTGLSTDEYVRSLGKFGTALELGQLGSSDHFNLGLGICKRALQSVSSNDLNYPVLRLSGSYKVKNASYRLDPGWKNLKSFTSGERLGSSDEGVLRAPVTGFMLFPRYRTLSEGEDLFYYCTPWENGRPLDQGSSLYATTAHISC
jgi:succinylglutamate desuccinylase